jgi:hypothetical protein
MFVDPFLLQQVYWNHERGIAFIIAVRRKLLVNLRAGNSRNLLQDMSHQTTVFCILLLWHKLEVIRRFGNVAKLAAVIGYSADTPLHPHTAPTFLFMASYKWYSSLPGELVVNNK